MDFFSQNTGYLYMGIGVFVLFILILFFVGYTKAPPDVAKIISGLMKVPRVLAGRAGLRIPFLERVDEIYLGQISVLLRHEAILQAGVSPGRGIVQEIIDLIGTEDVIITVGLCR